MERLILIIEISACVALVATIREGLRRRSEGIMFVGMLLLFPAGIFLLSDITTDRRSRYSESRQTPSDPEERERAMQKLTREWAENAIKNHNERADGGVICVFPSTLPPADATAPEN